MKVRATGQPPALPDAQAILAALAQGCTERSCPCAGAARKGKGLTHCPAHEDGTPSLSVTPHTEHGVLLKCHAGCTQAAVIDALRQRGLWPERGNGGDRRNGTAGGHGRATRTEYRYVDADGVLVATKVRIERPGEKKTFVIEPAGVRVADLPLYRLPDLLRADPAIPVLFPEGEKDTDRLRAAGFLAITTAGGAGQQDFGAALDPLKGRDVVLIPDADQVGHAYMRRVRAVLTGGARRVSWLDLPGVAPKGDISDWLAGGGMPDQLRALNDAAPEAATHGPGCTLCGETEAPGGAAEPPALPRFPVHVYPPAVAEVVAAAARAIDCPPDFVAVPLLGIAAACIGNRVAVEIKPGWQERANLWLAVIGHPGTAKSAGLDVSFRRLHALQREARDTYRQERETYAAVLAAWESAKDKAQRGPKPEEPQLEHLYSNDYTIEALVKALGHEDSITPGLALVMDELVGWVLDMGQYKSGRSGERARWLALWSGAPLKSDRAGREHYAIDDPVIPVVGGIQPDRLRALEEEAALRDGFIDRILFARPAARAVRFSAEGLPAALTDRLTDLFRRLRRTATGTVPLAPTALAVWAAWHDHNADQVDACRGFMAGILAKMPRQVARLALVLHLLSYPDDGGRRPLSAATMAQAIELGAYFTQHAARVMTAFGEAATVADPLAVRVLRLLRAATGDRWLTRAVLHERLGGHVGGVSLNRVLDELVTAGLAEVREILPGAAGGRPGLAYRIARDNGCDSTESTEETPTPAEEPPADGEVDSVSSVDSQGLFSGSGAGRVSGRVAL